MAEQVHDSDVGRRIARRRRELGFDHATVAARAGMDPGYVAWLEDSPNAVVTGAGLLRLAAALETSSTALLGGDVGRPPGPGQAAPAAHLEPLGEDESWRLLAPGGVGRFVFLARRGPVAVPVNYRIVDGTVVFRTAAHSSLAEVSGGEAVSLEVDHIDEAMSEGWSVLASGLLEHVDDPAAIEALTHAAIEPWADQDQRTTYLRFVPVEVTGRRIRAGR